MKCKKNNKVSEEVEYDGRDVHPETTGQKKVEEQENMAPAFIYIEKRR